MVGSDLDQVVGGDRDRAFLPVAAREHLGVVHRTGVGNHRGDQGEGLHDLRAGVVEPSRRSPKRRRICPMRSRDSSRLGEEKLWTSLACPPSDEVAIGSVGEAKSHQSSPVSVRRSCAIPLPSGTIPKGMVCPDSRIGLPKATRRSSRSGGSGGSRNATRRIPAR